MEGHGLVTTTMDWRGSSRW